MLSCGGVYWHVAYQFLITFVEEKNVNKMKRFFLLTSAAIVQVLIIIITLILYLTRMLT